MQTPESRYVTGALKGHPAVGQQVRVTSPKERSLLGTQGRVLGYSKPHGYAVLQTSEGEVLVHPEALELVDGQVQVGNWEGLASSVRALMDDDLREQAHSKAPCSDQDFVDQYCELHQKKYGAKFEVN